MSRRASACGIMAGKERSRRGGGGGARTLMSDRTPPGGGVGQTPETIEQMLSAARGAVGAGRERTRRGGGGGARTLMSDRTPPGGGFGQTPETIEQMLSAVRETLRMDVAFVSEFAGDELVFRAIEGDAESFGWREGESFPIDESYCKRVLDGRIPRAVPDAKRERATRDLRVTTEGGRRSYCAGPRR